MPQRLFEARLNQLRFADLYALKQLKGDEVAEMVQRVSDDQDKMDFRAELAMFNTIIDRVIGQKISEIESMDGYLTN